MTLYTKAGASIPQAVIAGTLDSALDQFDSSDPILHFIQLVDAAVSIEPWKSDGYRLYYDSAGLLPTTDSAYEGMTVLTSDFTTGAASLHLHIGTEWQKVIQFDSAVSSFQADNQAFWASGAESPSPTTLPSPANELKIDYFPFASEGTSIQAGDLDARRKGAAVGTQSPTQAFLFGGFTDTPTDVNSTVTRFNLTTTTTANNLGDLLTSSPSPITNDAVTARLNLPPDGNGIQAGVSSEYFGYIIGKTFPGAPAAPFARGIVKFRFNSEIKAELHGDEYRTGQGVNNASAMSRETGFLMGGASNTGTPGLTSIINSFPFASDNAATGTPMSLTVASQQGVGLSSSTDGYHAGGNAGAPPAPTNRIDKFPFAALSSSTDVGDLNVAKILAGSASSSTFGYTAGGFNPGGNITLVDKFPFTTPFLTATDVGDLSGAREIIRLSGFQS